MFTGAIPTFTGNHLRGLYLSENQFDGDIILSSISSLCQQTNIQEMFLNDNELTKSIPTCFGDLTNLQQLNLSNNQFTGQVPSALEALRALGTFALVH
jgi:LRR receptor-like serine/threonine-protein kinase FLS2